jgi:hypothetical protein
VSGDTCRSGRARTLSGAVPNVRWLGAPPASRTESQLRLLSSTVVLPVIAVQPSITSRPIGGVTREGDVGTVGEWCHCRTADRWILRACPNIAVTRVKASPTGTFGLGHSRTSQYAASGCYPQTAARVYPTRVAVIRTVSKFMTNEPP